MVQGNSECHLSNLNYLKQYDPEYVLILSGDHIYKMNYADMLQYHIEKRRMLQFLLLKYHGKKRAVLEL
ncbi:hypothetical protein JS44_07810 [Anoxybacillus flavithermus]|uniref:Nucleotidyl transferase domain-containing protein n=1 Tax=Anoxybacillus flavithermus TaxID=33934 RepID=A0A094J2Z8_9BACL|nr:hypothetical protein JS44_07810 [Anoxybacillus flavithermus]